VVAPLPGLLTQRSLLREGGPGRPRDCSPGLPQIRTCASKTHPVRHVVAPLPLNTARRFRGDTPLRLGVLGVVATPVHDAAPPSLPGVWEGSFPRFIATMRHCDSLPPISPHFVSFAWRYHRCDRCSPPPARDRAVDQPGVGKPGLQSAVTTEMAGSLRFPSDPHVPAPCSRTPVGPMHARPLRCLGAAPACVNNGGSRDEKILGLNRTALGLTLYASQLKFPSPTQDSLPAAGQALPGGIR